MTRRTPPRAFTLIELLVVIAIVGVLISILLPALGKARTRAREVQALSNTRTLLTSFNLYENTYRALPFITVGIKPDSFDSPPQPGVFFVEWYPKGTIVGTNLVWLMSHLWPAFIAKVAPWEESYKTWVSPGRSTTLPESPASGIATGELSDVSFRYAHSFLAQPRLWKKGGPGGVVDDTLLRATAISDVAFPSAKTIIYDADLAYLTKIPASEGGHWAVPTPQGFVDGHADMKNPKDALPPVPNPLNGNQAVKLHDTEDGVGGRDY